MSNGATVALALLLLISGVLFPIARVAAQEDSLELTMTVNKHVAPVGQEISFTLTLTNIGEEDVTIWWGSSKAFDLQYFTNLRWYRWSDGMFFPFFYWEVTLRPGESFSQTLQWNLYQYSLTGEFRPPKPGTYDVWGICAGHPGTMTDTPTRVTLVIPRVSLNFDPDTLNLESKGKWITAYIQLPEGYDAADINAATILLNGTISPDLDPKYDFVTDSSRYLVDHDDDGVLERMVKFDRTAVESWIYNTQGISYGNVALTVTGNLIDGTPFEGTDNIFVNYPGDANHDGTINIVDLSVVSAHWYPGPPTGPLGYDINADFNRDGIINLLEVAIISANWGQTVP